MRIINYATKKLIINKVMAYYVQSLIHILMITVFFQIEQNLMVIITH